MTAHPEVTLRSKAELKELRKVVAGSGPVWPRWARIAVWAPCAVGSVLVITTLPLAASHLKVVGGVVIWNVHFWWLLDSLVTGEFESKQGSYPRAEKPLRYWAMCLFMATMQLLMAIAAISAWYET